MSIKIQPPFELFTDVDGKPLEQGYIYLGEPNMDPQTNPITVYWDEARTIVAEQPIRTLSGYPVRNGSPANVYAASAFSARVNNKNGTLVFSVASKWGGIIIDLVGSVDNIAALRALNVAQIGGPIQPLGYYTPGDGGGGPVRVKLTAPAGGLTDNGGSIIKPGGAVGDAIAAGDPYWGWEWGGELNIDWFGAELDGDITTILQNIVSNVAQKGDVISLPRRYYISSIIYVNTPGITFAGPYKNLPPNENHLATNPEFTNWGLICASSFDNSAQSMFLVQVRSISFHGLLFFGNNTQTTIVDSTPGASGVYASACRVNQTKGSGFLLPSGGSFINQCYINGSRPNMSGTVGVSLATDAVMSDCLVEGFDIGVLCQGNHLQVSNSYSDLSRVGWAFRGWNSRFSNLKAGYNAEVGFQFGHPTDSSTGVNMRMCVCSNLIANGTGDSTYDAGTGWWLDNGVGFELNGGSRILLSNCFSGQHDSSDGEQKYGTKIAGRVFVNWYIVNFVNQNNNTSQLVIDAGMTGTIKIAAGSFGTGAPWSYCNEVVVGAGGSFTALTYENRIYNATVVAGEVLNPFGTALLNSASAVTLDANVVNSPGAVVVGYIMTIYNTGSFNITLPHGGRTLFEAGVNKVLAPNGFCVLRWNGASWLGR